MPKGIKHIDPDKMVDNALFLVDKVKLELKEEEFEHQKIRMKAYSSLTHRAIKDVLVNRLGMNTTKYKTLKPNIKKIIKTFEFTHQNTNIMDKYKKPGKEVNSYDEAKKLLVNWKNQNISKYNEFFCDMFIYVSRLSKLLSSSIFQDEEKANMLERILTSRCHHLYVMQQLILEINIIQKIPD